MIKQGYPKKQFTLKERIIEKQTARLLNSDPGQLTVPRNGHYGTKEMQYYLEVVVLETGWSFTPTTITIINGVETRERHYGD